MTHSECCLPLWLKNDEGRRGKRDGGEAKVRGGEGGGEEERGGEGVGREREM